MEDERAGDLRVPIISSLLCLFVTAGGIFLVLYVYFPSVSQPWYPVVAFLLIGSPWIFWFFTYIYTFMKGFFGSRAHPEGQVSQMSRRTTRVASSATRPSGGTPQVSSVPSSKESELPLAYSV